LSATLETAIFLSMNGRAKEAIAFYKKHFGAEALLLVTYEDMAKRDGSMRLTEENRHCIAHSVLAIGKTKVMMAEDVMDATEKYAVGNNFSLCIQSADLEEIRHFYNSATSDDRVRIIAPLSANVFSKAYGIIEDPFGVQIQLMYDDRLR